MSFSNALITWKYGTNPLSYLLMPTTGTSLLQMHCCCHLSCGIHIPYTTVCCFFTMNTEWIKCVFLSNNKPELISRIYAKPLKSNLQQQQPSTTSVHVSRFNTYLFTLRGLRTAAKRRQGSCYLQGPSWVDLSICFLTVWLLFSGGRLTSDNGKLLGPSTDGPDTTWFSWSGSCLGGASEALDECPPLTNRQRHGSDLDDSGELGGLITMLDSGGGRGGEGAVCSLSGLSSTSSEILQTGQVEFCSSHKSIQAMWKLWLQ